MKVERFFAKNMNLAIQQVKEKLGPDAVILSTTKAGEGIEILASNEYPNKELQGKKTRSEPTAPSFYDTNHEKYQQVETELKQLRGLLEEQLTQLAWNDLKMRSPVTVNLLHRLSQCHMSPELSELICSHLHINPDDNLDALWQQSLQLFSRMIPIIEKEPLDLAGIKVLVGGSGVGKSTMIAKMAARYSIRHSGDELLIISADSVRIGAHEQLKSIGRLLGVDVLVVDDFHGLPRLLSSIESKSMILVDTPALATVPQEQTLFIPGLKELQKIADLFLVVSATSQLSHHQAVVRSLRGITFSGAMITKLDEARSLGEALSLVIENNLPLAYLSQGNRIPDDLSIPKPMTLVHSMADRILDIESMHNNQDSQNQRVVN